MSLHLLFHTQRWWASIFRLLWNFIFSTLVVEALTLRTTSSVGPSSHTPLLGMQHPRPTRVAGGSLTISSSIMLCRTQQAKKICLQLAISRYWNPRSNDFHRPFKIPKQHSTSFRTLSRFAEKHDSRGVFPSDLMKGQINVGHCKYPLSQMRYAPFSWMIFPYSS